MLSGRFRAGYRPRPELRDWASMRFGVPDVKHAELAAKRGLKPLRILQDAIGPLGAGFRAG